MTRTMTRLTGETWRAFTSRESVVLTLGRTDCAPCHVFEDVLAGFLARDTRWPDVHFGKILLDTRGFHHFKKENPWLRGVEVLPYTLLYRRGEQVAELEGGNLSQLEHMLEVTFSGSAQETSRAPT